MKFSFLCPIERNNTPLDLFPPSLGTSVLGLSLTLVFSLAVGTYVVFDFDLPICSPVLGFSSIGLSPFLSLGVPLPLLSGCMLDLSSKTEKVFPPSLWTFVTASEIHMPLSYLLYISLSWPIKVLHLMGVFFYRMLSYFVYVRVLAVHLAA